MAAAITPFRAPDSCGSREWPPVTTAAETSAAASRRSSPKRSSSAIAAHGSACAAESHHSTMIRSTKSRSSKSCTDPPLDPRSGNLPLRPSSAKKWSGEERLAPPQLGMPHTPSPRPHLLRYVASRGIRLLCIQRAYGSDHQRIESRARATSGAYLSFHSDRTVWAQNRENAVSQFPSYSKHLVHT